MGGLGLKLLEMVPHQGHFKWMAALDMELCVICNINDVKQIFDFSDPPLPLCHNTMAGWFTTSSIVSQNYLSPPPNCVTSFMIAPLPCRHRCCNSRRWRRRRGTRRRWASHCGPNERGRMSGQRVGRGVVRRAEVGGGRRDRWGRAAIITVSLIFWMLSWNFSVCMVYKFTNKFF